MFDLKKIIKSGLVVGAIAFAALPAFSSQNEKPLPSDWKSAVCNLYVFRDPNGSLENMIKKVYTIQRDDCVLAKDSDSICTFKVQEKGASDKADTAVISDKLGNTATYSFRGFKEEMHLYSANLGVDTQVTDKNGNVIVKTGFQRFGSVSLPLADGSYTRFTIECDPDVTWGPQD